MDWRRFLAWNVATCLSALLGKLLWSDGLDVFRICISFMTGCLITAWVGKWAQGFDFVTLGVSLWISWFLGGLVFDHKDIAEGAMYLVAQPTVAVLVTISLVLIWKRRSKADSSLNRKLFLDEPVIVIAFLVFSISITAIVGLVMCAIFHKLTLDSFLEFWSSEAVGLIVTLPALLQVFQTDWGSRLHCNWRKAIPAALLSATESVEKQVEERTAELVKANQEKTDFMSFLCHELRSPLHIVRSMADMALIDDSGSEFAKASSTAAQYMTDLCNDVLDAAKLKSGKSDIKPKWMNLPAVLRDQCHSFSNHAMTLGINLQYHCDSDVPERVYTDDLRWRQCLTNLLANACRFTKAGGSVDVYLHHIRDSAIPPDHVRLRCDVTDTGIGIDPSHIPTLFVPFSIASQQTTREYQGSGLGLSLSAMLVEAMGGELKVESQQGHGSRFWFELVVPTQPSIHTVDISDENNESKPLPTNSLEYWEKTSRCPNQKADPALVKPHSLVDPDILVEDPQSSTGGVVGISRLQPSTTLTGVEYPYPILPESAALIPSVTQPTAPTTFLSSPRGSHATQEHTVGALVVDDSDVNRALLKRMLTRLRPHMQLPMANDGQEAIDFAEQYKYQIIFMDLQMPRVDGWTAIAHIRKEGLNIETPIIITSANTVTEKEQSFAQCGVLAKPFLVKDLKDILDRYHM
ncbi:hypothetical protein SmJEL517_g02108 [Synchytrium microbalum]|uniref:histidine kinase n=1 Tax=Synchytrium microbalum TaxID=1806994 RepID=A0A507CDF3_9FUNG|nr:uncharacterized protein SmJEL517_g02108 [Synchytrium microbalum]TPX35595.1 hypothetical protein SmJEL517_g02108 [Synchytrium microbalum]